MEINEISGQGYAEQMALNAARMRHHPQTVTSNTVGAPIAPTDDNVPVNPALTTSNTGPAGISSQRSPGQNAAYALSLFREMQAYNNSEILALMDHTSSTQSLNDNFLNFGQTLSSAAQKSGMATVLYHLNAENGLTDTHAAEGMGLDEFRRGDGTFDMASALAEITLLREGERSSEAQEKEATYLDNVLAQKDSGEWDEFRKTFEDTAAKGALVRHANENPEFASAYAADPAQAVRDHLHKLTNNVMNTTIAYENGVLSAFL